MNARQILQQLLPTAGQSDPKNTLLYDEWEQPLLSKAEQEAAQASEKEEEERLKTERVALERLKEEQEAAEQKVLFQAATLRTSILINLERLLTLKEEINAEVSKASGFNFFSQPDLEKINNNLYQMSAIQAKLQECIDQTPASDYAHYTAADREKVEAFKKNINISVKLPMNHDKYNITNPLLDFSNTCKTLDQDIGKLVSSLKENSFTTKKPLKSG